jgi:hypothetical protein
MPPSPQSFIFPGKTSQVLHWGGHTGFFWFFPASSLFSPIMLSSHCKSR